MTTELGSRRPALHVCSWERSQPVSVRPGRVRVAAATRAGRAPSDAGSGAGAIPPAFWMLGSNFEQDAADPANQWPNVGEIDIMDVRVYQPVADGSGG